MIQKKSLSEVYFFWRDFSIFIVSIIQQYLLCTNILQNLFQCILTASVTTNHICITSAGFFYCTSGLPICLLKLADIWVKIFALQLNCLQTFLYWHTILSCPPMITTLILNLPKLRSDYLLLYLLLSCMFYEFISTYLPCSLVVSNLCIYYTITET